MSAFLLRFQHGYIPSVPVTRLLSGQRSQGAPGTLTSPSGAYVIYANGVLDPVNFTLANDLSFQCVKTYNASFGGQTCLQIATNTVFGGGWQPASNWGVIPPSGFDMSPYTALQFDINIPSNAGLYVGAHYTRATGNDIGTSTSATQGSSCFAGVTPNTWTTVTVPLANIASLSSYNFYKFAIGTNQSNQTFYLNNVKLLAGNTGWILRGVGALESGFITGGSGVTSDYTWLPNSLNATLYAINNPPAKASVLNGTVASNTLTVNSLTSGTINGGEALFYNSGTQATIGFGGPTTYPLSAPPGGLPATAPPVTGISMGTAPYQANITGVKVTSTGTNPIWYAYHTGGIDLTPFANLTFGAIPTKAGYGYSLRLVDINQGFVGSAVAAAGHAIHDFGVSTGSFTVYTVPLSAFGGIPSTIGGVQITETSANTTNVWYMSAIGFTS